MEIIDISKFYRFESIPSPLLIASDILNFNKKTKNEYIEIDNCNKWLNDFNVKKQFEKFDQIITNYFKTNDNSESILTKNNNIKKVLNHRYIYLIIKITRLSDSNLSFTILPISNFEDLSNSAINRLYLHRDGLFEINPNLSYDQSSLGKSKTNHRFYHLNELLTTQGVFDSELDTKTKDLTIETEEDLLIRKGLTNKILGDDPKFYSMSTYENLDYLPEIDPEPEQINLDDKDSIWLQKYGIPRQDYEYNEAEMDNILFSNPIKYRMPTSNKIFPLFENLHDAENFLLTIFEDLLEPMKKKKISMTKQNFFELTRKEQYTLLLPNSYILNIDNSEIIDPTNFKKYNLDQIKENSLVNNYTVENFDQNAFLTISNSFLLDQSINIGIIRIGLGDFLNLWFSLDMPQEKNISKIFLQFLKYFKDTKSDNFKGNLLFIPKLISKNQDIFESNYLDTIKYIKNYNKIFKIPKSKVNSTKFKFIYQLGKVMDLNDINSFIISDLKL